MAPCAAAVTLREVLPNAGILRSRYEGGGGTGQRDMGTGGRLSRSRPAAVVAALTVVGTTAPWLPLSGLAARAGAATASGDFDDSFGDGGLALARQDAGAIADDTLVQPDGRIVIAGTAGDNAGYFFARFE